MSIQRRPLFEHRLRLWTLLAASGALLLFWLGTMFPSAWLSGGVYHIDPYFSDLHAVLAASDAAAAGADPYAVPNPYDVMGRPHVYGPGWLLLHNIGLTRQQVPWLGVVLLAGAVAAGSVWLRPRSAGDALLAAGWLASPAFLLAYERGNNDLVMLFLLMATGVAGERFRGWKNGLAFAALLMAALLKFYPAAAAGALLARGSRRAVACRLLSWVGGAGLLVAWQWPLFVAAFQVSPVWTTVYGFGLPVIARFLDLLPGALPWFMAGALQALVILWAVFRRTPFRRWTVVLVRDPVAGAWLAAGGGAWAACFILLGNYPYRAVLLLPVVAAWLRAGRACESLGRSAREWAWLGAAMVWLLSPYCHLMLSASPLARCLGYMVGGAMHTLSIGLTLCIMVLVFRWVHARWRHADE